MNTRVIIMSDGTGSRWNHPDIKFKQLININNTPLTLRTIYQLSRYTTDIILISPDVFRQYIKIPDYVTQTTLGYRDNEKRLLLEGILRTAPFWRDRTVILLGDVIYSHACIRALFEIDFPLWILGRTTPNHYTGKQARELFSLIFNLHETDVAYNIKTILNKPGCSGKLWDFYFSVLPPLIEINDWTDDLDSLEAYKEFYEKIRICAYEEQCE